METNRTAREHTTIDRAEGDGRPDALEYTTEDENKQTRRESTFNLNQFTRFERLTREAR